MAQQPTPTVPAQTQTPQAQSAPPQQTTPQPVPAQPAQPAATPGQVPPKKSLFKRWWFWLIVLVVLGIGAWLLFF